MQYYTRFVIICLFIAFLAENTVAQTCTGSLGDPVVDITFGAGPTGAAGSFGETGPPLAPGVTNLQYTNDPCSENDGSYGLATAMRGCHAGTWQVLYQDHTGDPKGYFMLINGPDGGALVYSQTVKGSTLCPNTTYEFAAWVMNVLILTEMTRDWVVPNLTFSIETKAGKVLKSITVGDIPETAKPVWNEYGTFFTSPSDGSDVVIKIYDNQNQAGFGNDFAVDDITFRPCGPIIEAGFDKLQDTTGRSQCSGDDKTYTMVAQQQGYDQPVYQWQQNSNDGQGWVDIPGATDTVLTRTLNNPAAGLYQYRIGIYSQSTSSRQCRTYSKPLNVNAYPPPPIDLPPQKAICEGLPLQLYIEPAGSYSWTGPNGFTSSEQNPVVAEAATRADQGTYTVAVMSHGCSSAASTEISVYPKIIAALNTDTTICQGSAITLSAAQSQGAQTYSWSPAAGLNSVDKPAVEASPDQTTTYTVTLTNPCGEVQRSVKVTVLPKPTVNAGAVKTIQQGESVRLNGAVSGDSIRYYWTPAEFLDNPNSLTPHASPPQNITYTLHVVSAASCGIDSSSVFVRVYQKVTVPNTFTPNNDGINDYWDISNLNTYPESMVQVFDRYGQLVFQSAGYPKPWDGTKNGKPLPAGTYYYVIDLKNGSPKMSGWMLLVR